MCSGAVAHGRGVLPGFFISKYGQKNAQGIFAVLLLSTESSKRKTCA